MKKCLKQILSTEKRERERMGEQKMNNPTKYCHQVTIIITN